MPVKKQPPTIAQEQVHPPPAPEGITGPGLTFLGDGDDKPELLIIPKGAVIKPARLDKTVIGGRYVVDGVTVNCNGEAIQE